jgi:elongation factor P
MATISMGDLKKGVRLELDGNPYRVVEFQHVKPGKGAAFVRCKIKNLSTGKVIEKTVHAGDKFEVPDLEQTTMQYLYDDGEMLQFMDNDTYDQIGLTYDQCSEAMKWLKDGTNVDIIFYKGKAISVEVPATMEFLVTETGPKDKGDTTSGSKKPATIETGVVIQIPYHILEGDTIRVNTVDAEYLEKVK